MKNRVIAQPHPEGMSLHIIAEDGTKSFMMLHRHSSDLFAFLRNSQTIESIYKFKPGRNKREQKMYSSLRHIIKVAEWVETYEAA